MNFGRSDAQRDGSRVFWTEVRQELGGLAGGFGLNMGFVAVDRQAMGHRATYPALHWIAKDGRRRVYTYRDLKEMTDRFATLLRDLDVGRGDRVFTLLGPCPEFHVTVLGALKNGSVVCPLFAAFGPEPIRTRLAAGLARVLVTTAAFYPSKVAALRDMLPSLEHVLLVGDEGEVTRIPGTLDFYQQLEGAAPCADVPSTDAEDLALLHFTSGTTGRPKGALHAHEAVLVQHLTGRSVLDFHSDDVFWCTAEPGWITGTCYGVIAPLTHGITNVVVAGGFDPERWGRVLAEHAVTVWYTTPTALRLLMRLGADGLRRFDLGALRLVASVGEPLPPDAVRWGQDVFGVPIRDTWWQTETGAIMIANDPATEVKPGSMGRPVPGIEAAVVRRSGPGRLEVIDEPGVVGELALRTPWPSLFRGYLGDEAQYHKCFVGGFYLSGDLVRRDADGHFWFVARDDDVIQCAGHLIGPFEVESVLLEHPAVADVAVIGKADSVAQEVGKAFVVLGAAYTPSEELGRLLRGVARKRLGPGMAPKEIEFVSTLPKTNSGKIRRRLLRNREWGLPEGDPSPGEEREQVG